MRCEVCGRKILGSPYRAVIEGAKMLVCSNCAKLGSITWEERSEPRLKKVAKRLPQPVLAPRKQPSLTVAENIEMIDDFGWIVRQAREKLGLTHEDLGKKISEKVSVLRKVESGKMTPDNLLADKLEHALHVKILVPVSEPKVPPKAMVSRPTTPTLADIAQMKKDKQKEK
jgi:putative transcription factor